jgi:hypothetical protein
VEKKKKRIESIFERGKRGNRVVKQGVQRVKADTLINN